MFGIQISIRFFKARNQFQVSPNSKKTRFSGTSTSENKKSSPNKIAKQISSLCLRCFCLESHCNSWVNHLKICNKDPDLWYDLFFRYQLIILRTQLTLHIIFILLFRSKTVSQSFSVQEALEEARRGKMAVGVFLLLSLFQIFPFYNLYILSPSYHGGTLLQ